MPNIDTIMGRAWFCLVHWRLYCREWYGDGA